MHEKIIVRGAREHNLKNIQVEIPRDKLVVITGLSGSGKSSLAFDTIYAEGQRRYVESLSAYARQFLGPMEKPDVDAIEGLSPAISIEQHSAGHNPRSTVATMTEIYDYLRLLYAHVGTPFCYNCGKEIAKQTVEQIVDSLLGRKEGTRLQLLAPKVRGRKGEYKKLFEDIQRQGFVRVRVNGEIFDLSEVPNLDKKKKHNIEIVVDRLVIKPGIETRLADSLEIALQQGEGIVLVDITGQGERLFSANFACPDCMIAYEEIEPRLFSFNSPFGACPHCGGLGATSEIDPEKIVPNPSLSIIEGAITCWSNPAERWYGKMLHQVAESYGFRLSTPFEKLDPEHQTILLHGTKTKRTKNYQRRTRFDGTYFEGAIAYLQRRFNETASDGMRQWIQSYMSYRTCSECNGNRLNKQALSVKIDGRSIAEVTQMSVQQAYALFADLHLTERQEHIAHAILKEIRERLGFLSNVGLEYLSLDRRASTLSGGEAQRIRLATQIGSSLMGVLYVLDEPSIGLHPRDNRRLLETLFQMRDLGNTVIVVEHDKETILSADFVLDLGPGAGKYGGSIVAQGTPEDIKQTAESLTGAYISNRKRIEIPEKRRAGNGYQLTLVGASENNLKHITVDFPLGKFICVTGVSGSGKSTLINETLYKIAANHFNRSTHLVGKYQGIKGLNHIDKIINIDQSPIGRTPRSNPATYTGLFTPIREIFAKTHDAKVRGYKPGRFSFNVKGGRCEACEGAGMIKIEMHFLPDIYVPCEVCKGRRYNRETLEIRYKGKTIYDVLEMTVDEALNFFESIPQVARRLQTLYDVGLGYIHLGQSATTLSGGEAQRVKLSSELSKIGTGNTLYILDEPTTGLHFEDVRVLLNVLNRLVDKGNTVVVIEHNLDVIKVADHIIDLGPEGGENGGEIIATGTPEAVAAVERSWTGKYLKTELGG